MPVAELLARTSSAELAEWMAYERIAGPLGPERGDILHGIAAAVVANANRGRRGRQAKPKDFVPEWDDAGTGAQMSPDEMLAAVRGINTALGGQDLKGRGGRGDP